MTYIYLFLLFCLHNISGQVVNTTQGLINGLASEDGSYYMYLGIPYGVVDPDNPFGPSSPHPAFDTTFDAVNDSATCPQFDAFRGELFGSLDCLHLSVFSPASATNLPVMVFIHGGGFAVGFYGTSIYNPKFLVRHGIVVVTLNYRLGPFGFMCTEDARVPGNQGLKDQLMALRWINENIGNFGGDASKVTLVGNSAGSTSADLQLIRSHDPQLFNQIILQSGTSYMPFYRPAQRTAPLVIAKHFGLETEDLHKALDYLSTVDPLQIIVAVNQLGLVFGPCIEKAFDNVDAFVTENWMRKEVISSAKDFKVMIGFNDNEALGLFVTPGQDLTDFVENSLRPAFDVDNEDFKGMSTVRHFFFGDDEILNDSFQEIIDLRSDLSFVYLSMKSIDRFLKSEVEKVYLYVFAYDGERNVLKNRLNTTHPGAAHGDEIGYLWDISYLGMNENDQVIVDRMTTMWANFVKYGDPTPEQTSLLPVKWEAIGQATPYHYMHIDDNLRAGARPYYDRMTFWDLFYETNADFVLFMNDF